MKCTDFTAKTTNQGDFLHVLRLLLSLQNGGKKVKGNFLQVNPRYKGTENNIQIM
jgi:hypothetical protein